MKKNKKQEKPLIEKIIEKERSQRENKNTQLKVLEKSTMNKRLIYIMIFFISIFLAIVFYLVYFQLFKSQAISSNNHNKRFWVDENSIDRGNIYDRNGELLVYNEKDNNGYNYRVYNYGKIDASFTGYNSITYGKTGIEKNYNSKLLNIPDKSVSKLRGMIEKTGRGYDVNLSINQKIQNIAYKYLGDRIGSIVVMNPSTGEVLAMVSNPTFDPNSIDQDWNELIQNADAPLLNRVTQGIYRPGSTFKVITTTAILESQINQEYNDTGTEKIQGYDINNYDDLVFGPLDLRSAFINSVNTYFASKTNQLGREKFREVSEKYMFNKTYDFDIDIQFPKIPFDELNDVDLAMTGFGYGKTQVSPLHMAMVVSTIANNGRMMKPILVKSVTDENGKFIEERKAEVLSEVTSQSNAELIRELMVGVVNEGTATEAYIPGIQVAGKTGTADKANESTDAWFIGFAPAYSPQIAISIVLENDGLTGGQSAAPIAGQLISDIISNVNLE